MLEQIMQSIQGAVPAYSAYVDQSVAHWFRERLTTATRADLFLSLSLFGSEAWTAGILVTLLFYLGIKRHWRGFATLLLTVPFGALLGQVLKHWFQRPRPFLTGPWGEWGGYSFPSGHTLAATLLYVALLLILLPLLTRKRWRFAATLFACSVVLGVALSRVALGAHYVTDVMAAMAFGSVWAMLCALLVEVIHRRLRPALAR